MSPDTKLIASLVNRILVRVKKKFRHFKKKKKGTTAQTTKFTKNFHF